jgi:glucokinase
MNVLVDIGGTYARFALEAGGKPVQMKKYAAADFETFESALARYLSEAGAKRDPALFIATAAHPDERNVWRFVNKNKWVLDVAALGNVEIIMNDFEAATWGLIGLTDQKILKTGKENRIAPRVLIGPGTGLGLGYLIPAGKGFDVRGTQGGHLATAALNDEHTRVLRAVDKIKGRDCLNVYEDVVSGPGLYNLYAALCDLSEEERVAKDAGEMIALGNSLAMRDALRLFHEFFALFAATVAVGAGAYGGLYLAGGVLDRLMEKNLFDYAHFEKFFAGNYVPSVKKALDQTPIVYAFDPHLALSGLIRAANA